MIEFDEEGGSDVRSSYSSLVEFPPSITKKSKINSCIVEVHSKSFAVGLSVFGPLNGPSSIELLQKYSPHYSW